MDFMCLRLKCLWKFIESCVISKIKNLKHLGDHTHKENSYFVFKLKYYLLFKNIITIKPSNATILVLPIIYRNIKKI